MKKIIALLLIISATAFANECPNNPREGQICVGAKNLPSSLEASDQAGRKITLAFSKSNIMECQVELSGFQPNAPYECSLMTFGETKSFSRRVSSTGGDRFPLNFTPENKVRCACTSPSSFIKIISDGEKKPLQITINWDK